MACYETAGALQSYVNKRVNTINDLLQELPDISVAEDVIDDISDVSKYLSELSAYTDGKVSDKLKNTAKELSDSLSAIKNFVKDLKSGKLTVSYKNSTEETDYTKSLLTEKEFLSQRFPKILN